MERSSDYIGNIPMIFLAPDDEKLIFGSGIERRKLMDKSISQFERTYLVALMNYKQIVESQKSSFTRICGPS